MKRFTAALICLFWLGIFGYMVAQGLTTVVILSLIVLGMTMAFAMSNDN